MEEDKNSLFRKKALENINVTQQLDQRIKIVTVRAWVLALTLIAIITGIVVWGFLGNVPMRVDGKGILLAQKGSLFNAVAPEGTGRIVNIAVKHGDFIEKGQVVAYLATPDLQKKYEVAKKYLLRLQSEYNEMQVESKEEIKKRKAELKKQSIILNRVLKAEQEHLAKVEELLKIKQQSFKKGITTRQDVIATTRDYYSIKSKIETVLESLAQNTIKETDFINQWHEKLRGLELKIAQQKNEVDNLEASISITKDVRSPVAGIVTHIQVSVGEKVDGGETVATISTKGDVLDAIIYIPAEKGKSVKVGMDVLISPSTIKREEYGSIEAKVIFVSQFPSTAKSMEAIIQNEKLVQAFTEQGSPIAIRAVLRQNKNNYSGYEWTSSYGPETLISAGTLIEAMITVENKRPISLIIPTIKKLLGR